MKKVHIKVYDVDFLIRRDALEFGKSGPVVRIEGNEKSGPHNGAVLWSGLREIKKVDHTMGQYCGPELDK